MIRTISTTTMRFTMMVRTVMITSNPENIHRFVHWSVSMNYITSAATTMIVVAAPVMMTMINKVSRIYAESMILWPPVIVMKTHIKVTIMTFYIPRISIVLWFSARVECISSRCIELRKRLPWESAIDRTRAAFTATSTPKISTSFVYQKTLDLFDIRLIIILRAP